MLRRYSSFLASPLLLFSISSPILSLQAPARAEYKRKEFYYE
nr:MAG TPA: hypothetical protein [Caudoviricetes sp.]